MDRQGAPIKRCTFFICVFGGLYVVMGVDLSVYSFVGRGLMGNSSVKSGEIIDAIQICRITINSILKGYCFYVIVFIETMFVCDPIFGVILFMKNG